MMPTLLNDRYRVIRVLAKGGFGETFLVEDSFLPSKRLCVLKQLKLVADDPQVHLLAQNRFQREAAILEELGEACEQIPALYAYFEENDQFYLVQEWIEGQTLSDKVRAEGLFSEVMIRQLLADILPVLCFIHDRGIIHRDIKPSNIILRRTTGQPVLIDFGAVKEPVTTLLNAHGYTMSSIVIGTPGYMPAE
ncbi:MAG TPA: serine/threonine-protein kinase, partial [Allocoleopsis sp.]